MNRVKKFLDKSFLLYVTTGVLNYLLCTFIMFLLYNLGLCSMDAAALVNYTLGGFIWYFACWKLVFPGQKQSPALVLRFVVELLVCYLVSYCLAAPALLKLAVAAGLFPDGQALSTQAVGNYTMAIGSVTYAILNYFGQRFFVFSAHEHAHRFHLRRPHLSR